MVTEASIRAVLDSKFGGVLTAGKHSRNGRACALEALSVVQGVDWTDSPVLLRIFDLRTLNDMSVSDALRTKMLLPLLAAYAGSMDWPIARQRAVSTQLIVLTVNRLISEFPGLSEVIRTQCRSARTCHEARDAALAARAASADLDSAALDALDASAARDALAAIDASAALAASAASAARDADTERIFLCVCAIWKDAVISQPLLVEK